MPSTSQLLDIIATQTEIAKLGLDLAGTMALVVERTLTLIEADGAAIELAEGDEMVYRAGSGAASGQLGLRIKLEGSLSGRCVTTGEILFCGDAETDPRVDREACRKVGLRSMIVVPLRYDGETVGVLKAMSARPGHFDEADVQVLDLLSELIAAAMYFSSKYDSEALFYRATHDEMTGLANRALYIDRLRSVLARHHREKRPAGVLMIDMDGLKQLNDTFGHRVGDAAIKEMARRLQACARETDTVARLGGDEFGVILSPVEMPEGGEVIIQRIQKEIEPPLLFDGREFPLRASIGAAAFPDDGADIESLLHTADQRMYRVKGAQRRSNDARPAA